MITWNQRMEEKMRQMISRLNQLSLGVHRVNETMARHDLSYGGVGKLVFYFFFGLVEHTHLDCFAR